jgi:hypothetical protein
MGAALVRQVASKTNDIAGDGTTTATVLTRAIFSEGCKVSPRGAYVSFTFARVCWVLDRQRATECRMPLRGLHDGWLMILFHRSGLCSRT